MVTASSSQHDTTGSGPAAPEAPGPDLRHVAAILRRAQLAGVGTLPEPDGLALLSTIGIAVPRHVVIGPQAAVTAADLSGLGGRRVVVKVVAEGLAHKSDLGGVVIVPRTVPAVASAVADMAAHLAGIPISGFLVEELVEHEAGLGGELLLALRWTSDFGPVIGIGAGGIHAELLARDLRSGHELAVVAPGLTEPAELPGALRASTAVRLATEPQRGRPALLAMPALLGVVDRLATLAPLSGPGGILDCEINPLAVTPGGLVALDILVVLDRAMPEDAGTRAGGRSGRPLWKLDRLLEPASIAIAGVSTGDNPGRTILRNLVRDGFPPARITVIKPGIASIEGCRCVPDVASMPEPVDLLVIALSAASAAAMVADAAERDAAATIIVIPGGLEEKAGGEVLAGRMRAAIEAARGRPGGGPLINGGNCLGIRSGPGRYDTFFIPASKLAPPGDHPAPLAIVAQSGAFALSRLSRLRAMDPKYVITVGNQMDLTVGDHLDHLRDDGGIRVFGVYVEGFAPLDGRRFLTAARAVRERGGVVILYRAGRTAAGASASASHTASIAGDALVTEQLARQAGVVVAGSLEEFDDLVRTFTLLDGRSAPGGRLGALSNAGFECVAIGDNLGGLELASFDPATTSRLGTILAEAGLADIVDIHDPFDLTPMGDDAAFAAVAEAILADDGVDVGLIGDVPFTAAQQTLPPDAAGGEDLTAPGAVASRLVDLWRRTTKAWVAVIDAGPAYDPLALALEAGGIPTFRTADRALRCLGAVVAARAAATWATEGAVPGTARAISRA